MGADIHLVLERHVGDKWVAVDTFKGHPSAFHTGDSYNYYVPVAASRNYPRFAALAGVRGDGPEPLGLPSDVSDTTKYLVDHWGADGHSHSWLPVKEAAKVFAETDTRAKDKYFEEYPEIYYFGVEDEGNEDQYRLIFWFDN